MGYEIDFLPIGDKSSGGDAICIRFGDLHGDRSQQYVMVVDGGYQENGDDIVNHIAKFYGTNKIDLVLCTHADQDHIGGLATVLEKMDVKELALHTPWVDSNEIFKFIEDGRRTEEGTRTNLMKALSTAKDLADFAEANETMVWQPFAGTKVEPINNYAITVLGPSEEYHRLLMANYLEGHSKVDETSRLAAFLDRTLIKFIEESMDLETLTNPAEDATTPMNNSSAILHLNFGGKIVILTGDAGVPALDKALDYADEEGISYFQPSFTQIPHHGSKRNVGPTLLNRLFGEPGQEKTRTAFVSAPKEGQPKHPSNKVLNAFKRRGCGCHSTDKGYGKYHYSHAPDRDGWSTCEPLPFLEEVEE